MESNGILASVPGEYVALATQALPPPETAEDRPYEVTIEAGHLGPVRMFARRQQVRHRRHRHWFWSVYRAESAA